MNVRNSTELEAATLLRQVRRLQPNQIARLVADHPEYVSAANGWVKNNENIQLVTQFQREDSYRDSIRDAFFSELEKNDGLRDQYLRHQERFMRLPPDQLPNVMDANSTVDMFLHSREQIKERLIEDYQIQYPSSLVTYDEYACFVLLTDDVMKVDVQQLEQTIAYFSDTISPTIINALQKTRDFLQDPEQFFANLNEETRVAVHDDDVENRYVNMSGAKLTELCEGGDMQWFYMNGFNLSKSDLRLANLNNAFLNNANLSDVNLDGASIDDIKLDGATYDKNHIAEVIRDNEVKKQALESQKYGKKSSLPGASSQGIFGSNKQTETGKQQRKQSVDSQVSNRKTEGKKSMKERLASLTSRMGRKR